MVAKTLKPAASGRKVPSVVRLHFKADAVRKLFAHSVEHPSKRQNSADDKPSKNTPAAVWLVYSPSVHMRANTAGRGKDSRSFVHAEPDTDRPANFSAPCGCAYHILDSDFVEKLLECENGGRVCVEFTGHQVAIVTPERREPVLN